MRENVYAEILLDKQETEQTKAIFIQIVSYRG